MAANGLPPDIDNILRNLRQSPYRYSREVVLPNGSFDVPIGTTPTTVRHPLRAVPRRVHLGPPSVDARVWSDPSSWTADTLTLQASVACTVRITVDG